MKSVVITGVAGFLGSHLAKHHLLSGDSVFGIDDFSSSSRKSAHLKDLRSFEKFELLARNICNSYREWEYTPNRVDLIYNFACPASPPIYQSMPVATMLTCVAGTNNMLQLAKNKGAVLVHASTSEVYGDPDVSPQVETYKGHVNSYGPRACYDEGKRAAEALCFDYRNTHNVDARLVRIFNTYGPNMDPYDGRVVSNFICQALRGEKLTVYGKGQQTRSFCYVDDLVRGIVALGSLDKNPETPVNCGNPSEFTILELATQVIAQVYGGNTFNLATENMIVVKPLPVDDPTQRCPDITKAKDLLDWEPKVELAEGLSKTIEYFRSVVRTK